MSVIQLAFLGSSQQVSGESGEGMLTWGRFNQSARENPADQFLINREPTGGQNQPANDIFQSTNVPGPGIRLQQSESVRRDCRRGDIKFRSVFSQEMLR